MNKSCYKIWYVGQLHLFNYENNFKVTYETRRIIISDGLGITKGFKYGVSLDDLVLQASLRSE
jgi:hypothetical protein